MISLNERVDFFNRLVASHVIEPTSSPTEPGAVVKFRDLSSHPVHVCCKYTYM